jgi:diguanylate cyclase (GGDEF)-like protein/PAS domain S-box-containing protein
MAGLALAAASVVLALPWWGTPEQRDAAMTLVSLPLALVSALLAWRASQPGAPPATRRAWRWIAASYAVSWIGDLWWLQHEHAVGASPIGSWADVPYVASIPLLLIGLLAFPYASRSRADRVKGWLDVATIVCAGAFAVWYCSFQAAIHGAPTDVGAVIATFGLPIGDLVILTGVATLWARRPAGPAWSWSLTPLAAGMGATFVAGLARAGDGRAGASGAVAHALGVVALVLVAWSAHRQRTKPEEQEPGSAVWRAWTASAPTVPATSYVAVALGYGLLVVVALRDGTETLTGLVFGAVVLTTLVVARQVASVRDNVRLAAEASAQRSEARFRSLVQHSSDAILMVDPDSTVRYASPSTAHVFGHEPHALLGTQLTALLSAADAPRALIALARVAERTGQATRATWRIRNAKGEWRHVETVATNLLGDETVKSLVLNTRDITADEEAAEALRVSEARYRLLFDASPQPMWVYDLESLAFLAVNDAAVAHYGYTRDEFLRMQLADIRPAAEQEALRQYVGKLAQHGGDDVTSSGEWQHRTRNGALIDVTVTSHPLVFDGRRARLVLAADITARKALEAQLSHQAYHDPLTELANRALFRERVEQALAHRGSGGVAVLFLDLDEFKRVNDSLGHGAGDDLLVAVASRLLNATRGCDTVARLGGDEFAVLLANVVSVVDAVTVADRITASLRAPVRLDRGEVTVGASIGIACASDGDGAEELLRNADVAMYRAKHGGRGRHEVFEPSMYADVVNRLEVEAELRHAVEQLEVANEFCVLYQPIVELSDGEVNGVEALVRWMHPRRGMVSPIQFIPTAESTGLIVPLGRWVLREACRQAAAWQHLRAADAPLTITVNISGRQLQDPALVTDVAAALADSGLSPYNLVLEITESVIMQRTDETLGALHALKALGVRLAIDDFGTGYSSLAYLQRFPIDILKIDKSFVDGVAAGGTDAALARTIIALGDMLSLRCVAEGIEEADQRAHLRDLGCTLGQGYYFARPMAPAALAVLLQQPTGGATSPAAERTGAEPDVVAHRKPTLALVS